MLFCYMVSRLRYFCRYFYFNIKQWALTQEVSEVPHTLCLGCCKDAEFSCVGRVSFLIARNYNAEPFKALIGKYCIHLELRRKYIGKQSVITQSGIGPRLEIHTPANSTRRFLMTEDDQASAPCLVQNATFAANPPSRVMGRDRLHGAVVPLSWQNWPKLLFFPLLVSAKLSTNKMRFCLSRDKCKPIYCSH